MIASPPSGPWESTRSADGVIRRREQIQSLRVIPLAAGAPGDRLVIATADRVTVLIPLTAADAAHIARLLTGAAP